MNKRLSSKHRPLLTLEELERMSVEEIYKAKLTEEERAILREINKLREQRRQERSERLSVEEQPILAELRAVGCNVHSVWDLVNTASPYPEAVQVLLKHLVLTYSDRTREAIARSLAVRDPQVREAWSLLVKEYIEAPHGKGIVAPGDTHELSLSAKDGLACALAVSVTDETMDELIKLIKDKSNGESRILLLSALRKSKNPKAKAALIELAFDSQLEKEISSWSRKKPKLSTH
jgi:hypothetical protein